jgi:hypothetical protein
MNAAACCALYVSCGGAATRVKLGLRCQPLSLKLDPPKEEVAAEKEEVPEQRPEFHAQSLPGICDPLGFFDPAGFSKGASEGRVRFYREVELKHGRVASTLPHIKPGTISTTTAAAIAKVRVRYPSCTTVLAALGFPLAEQFHPVLGSADVPSYAALRETPLRQLWPFVLLPIATIEVFSMLSASPFGAKLWSVRPGFESGNYDFDPLRLRPESKEEFKEMQTKELSNGRLAMIGIAGMLVQELVTGSKLW